MSTLYFIWQSYLPFPIFLLLGPKGSVQHVLFMVMAEAEDQVSPIVSALVKALLILPILISLAKTGDMVQECKNVYHTL